MKIGILRFPGTNCDRDVWSMAIAQGHEPVWAWHKDRFSNQDFEAVIVPGGFSYGDYLRCGALAAISPAVQSLKDFAAAGRPVLGICNGFQILCEAKLLPGVLVRNEGLRFKDEWVDLRVQNSAKVFLSQAKVGSFLRLPIAHGEGRYDCDLDTLKCLQDRGQIWLTYVRNPNGSVSDIAGVMNSTKNVMALMPHPERALFQWMGSSDGAGFI